MKLRPFLLAILSVLGIVFFRFQSSRVVNWIQENTEADADFATKSAYQQQRGTPYSIAPLSISGTQNSRLSLNWGDLPGYTGTITLTSTT